MEWLVYAVAISCMTRLSEEASVKCPQGWQDLECLLQNGVSDQLAPKLVYRKSIAPDESLPAGEEECLPGTTWDSNCHECQCLSSGTSACKLIEGCMGQVSEPIKCKPNSTFPRDCNTCICLKNGLGLCTLEPCQRAVKNKSDLPAGHDCAPYSFWKSRCNECGCSPMGYAYCTEKSCPDDMDKPLLSCAPDSMWKNECNTCWCTITGYALCTRMGCSLHVNYESSDVQISPQSDSNGTLSRRIREKEPPKACQPGQEFRLDCNKCLCDNEGQDFSCTRIDCTAANNNGGLASYNAPRVKREAAREVAAECVPGSVFDQQCNVCRCTADGKHAMCTLNRCSIQGEKETAPVGPDPGFRCNPGEQFKRGCNDCTCSADGKSTFCTLRLCDQDLTAGM